MNYAKKGVQNDVQRKNDNKRKFTKIFFNRSGTIE